MISSLLLMTFARSNYTKAGWEGRLSHADQKIAHYETELNKWRGRQQESSTRVSEIHQADELMKSAAAKVAQFKKHMEEAHAEFERLHHQKEELMKAALRDPMASPGEIAAVIKEVREEGVLADPDLVSATEVAAEQTLTREDAIEAAPTVYRAHAEMMPQEETAHASANRSVPEVIPTTVEPVVEAQPLSTQREQETPVDALSAATIENATAANAS